MQSWQRRYSSTLCCWYGHKETATLLSNKADVDVRDGIGRTPLMTRGKRQIEEVEILLAAKADVNARTLRGDTH